jgi:hypothetical protein
MRRGSWLISDIGVRHGPREVEARRRGVVRRAERRQETITGAAGIRMERGKSRNRTLEKQMAGTEVSDALYHPERGDTGLPAVPDGRRVIPEGTRETYRPNPG